MRFRLRRPSGPEREYGPHGYPPTLHIEPFISSGNMGGDWRLVPGRPVIPQETLSEHELRVIELEANGYVRDRSFVAPKRPVTRIEKGNFSIIQETRYETAAAAILAWRARTYYEQLVESYGQENVEVCRDIQMRSANDGYEPDEHITYYIKPPEGQMEK